MVIMKMLHTIFKGKLTELSLTTVIAGFVTLQTELIPAFTAASKLDINYIMVAGVIGAIWGKFRRKSPAYKNH